MPKEVTLRSVRNMRLWQDYIALVRFESDVVTWESLGGEPNEEKPPEQYLIHYDLRSIVGWKDEQPIYQTGFNVRVDLSPPYPLSPAKAWCTAPVPWHPCIHPDGRISFRTGGLPGIGISLETISEIIGKVIAYQLCPCLGQPTIHVEENFWGQLERCGHLFPTDMRSM